MSSVYQYQKTLRPRTSFKRELRLTLVGFLRGKRFIVYAGEERLNLS